MEPAPTSRCIFFASGQKDFRLVRDVTTKRIFLSPNYLENRNWLFLSSVPIFLPASKWSTQSRHFPYLKGEGTGAWAPYIADYFVVVVTLYFTTPGWCIWPQFYTSPLPCTWTFHPPYLSDSQMDLDCLIRESRHRVISSYLGSNCTQAAARPEICAPLIPLNPSGHWAQTSPSQPWTPAREDINSACKAQ